ncbi:MAG: hypothetical protein ACTSX6_14700 [Candidatus Heimdallarchaeaceae archaeon]
MIIVKVNIRNLQVINKVNRYLLALKDREARAVRQWGHILVKDLRSSAMMAGITPFKRHLLYGRGIRWEMSQRGYVGYLSMYQYGVFLDKMRPHYVKVKRTRKTIREWYSRKIRKLRPYSEPIIYVRPHPFINRGFRIARPKLTRLARQEVRYER